MAEQENGEVPQYAARRVELPNGNYLSAAYVPGRGVEDMSDAEFIAAFGAIEASTEPHLRIVRDDESP